MLHFSTLELCGLQEGIGVNKGYSFNEHFTSKKPGHFCWQQQINNFN